ncbi:ABC transporter substrate-binding protein [Ensifer adhaerens]|uniref:Extracellular solute-binding protein n=1 Tax=Ensifer adhaerens TaxID=106592 RepID=A0A9Q9DEA1_ENSAD|nr:extracellular solute-binding protein [Ensifer adhaerens]USJ28523.1 extracellular solute-binding protein [Ensifer adhaerens]
MISMKAVLAPILALAFSASSALAQEELQLKEPIFKKLYDDAQAAGEREVVYYTQARTEEAEALNELWAANFPNLSLKIVPKKAPELVTLVQAEKAAGRVLGDVITNTQPYIAELWKKEGRFLPYKTSSFEKLGNYADPEGAYYATGVYLLAPVFNTKLVAKEERPKSLADFLDPKWKGKIVIADPATAGNSRSFFLGMHKAGKLDWDYLEKLAQQDVLFVRTSPEIVRMIASGERSVTPSVSSHNVLTAMKIGQSIDLYGLSDGTLVTEQPSGILAGGPNPNGAKLLLEVLTSAQGQALLSSRANYWPTNADAQESAGLPSIDTFNPLQVDLSDISDAEADEFIARLTKTFGRE